MIEQSIEKKFEELNIKLVDHRLPVADRPKAVLELWKLYDKLIEDKKDVECQ